jgi:hypothetical protein
VRISSLQQARVITASLASALLVGCVVGAPSVAISASGVISDKELFTADVGVWRNGKTKIWARERSGSLNADGRSISLAQVDVVRALTWFASQTSVHCPEGREESFDLRSAREVRFERGDSLIYVFVPDNVSYSFAPTAKGDYVCIARGEWMVISVE